MYALKQVCGGNLHVPGHVIISGDTAVNETAKFLTSCSLHSTKGDKTTKTKRIKIRVVRWGKHHGEKQNREER